MIKKIIYVILEIKNILKYFYYIIKLIFYNKLIFIFY